MAFRNATAGDKIEPNPVVDHPRDHVGGPKPLEPTIGGEEKFQPQDFASVAASKPGPNISTGAGGNPKRSKQKTTAGTANISDPTPLT
jgi:hypothetical protein